MFDWFQSLAGSRVLAALLGAGVSLVLWGDPVVDYVDETGADSSKITFTGATATWIDMGEGKDKELVLKYTDTSKAGTLHIPAGLKVGAELLVVAGGGAGGTMKSASSLGGGGGGAGGVILYDGESKLTLSGADYSFTVGTGGPKTTSNTAAVSGESGNDTVVSKGGDELYRALGGGGGGGGANGKDGGSGGGASKNYAGGSAAGDGLQGFAGGKGGTGTASAGAGGGGAMGKGKSPSGATGGKGGCGITNDISGVDCEYAFGGGGGKIGTSGTGAAGSAGGGTGGTGNADGQDGEANTGSGGGGGGKNHFGGAGADGVVIIRLVEVMDPNIAPPEEMTLTWNGENQSIWTTALSSKYVYSSGVTNATKTGTYTYWVTPAEGFQWNDTFTTEARSATWKMVPKEVEKPVATATSFTYDGEDHNVGLTLVTGCRLTAESVTNATDAGTYSYTLQLDNQVDSTNYVWAGVADYPDKLADETVSWTIGPKAVAKPVATTTSHTYDGNEKTPGLTESTYYTFIGTTRATNANAYVCWATLNNPANATNYVWKDETAYPAKIADVEIDWSIGRFAVAKPVAKTPTHTYDGKDHNAGLDASVYYTFFGVTNATHRNTYTYWAELNNPADATNYVWQGASEYPALNMPYTNTWTISAVAVARPSEELGNLFTNLVFNGSVQYPVQLGTTNLVIVLDEGDPTSVTNEFNAGTYHFTIRIANPEDYVWADTGDTEDYDVEWHIAQAPNEISLLTLTGWRTGNKPKAGPTISATWGQYTVKYTYAASATAEEWTDFNYKNSYPSETGTWYLKANIAATGNYMAAQKIVSFMVWDDPGTIFDDHVEIRIDGYAGSATLEKFPVLVKISESAMTGFQYSRAGDDGKELAFILGDEMLDYDIENWNTSGESLVWVKVPTLAKGTELEMWWHLKDGQTTSGPSPAGVWSDYAGVWHFNDKLVSASVTPSADSTGKGLDGYPDRGTVGSASRMTSQTGVIGKARAIETTLCQYNKGWGNHLVVSNNAALNVGSTFTYSTWVDFDNYDNNYPPVLVSRKEKSGSGDGWGIALKADTAHKTLEIRGNGSTAAYITAYSTAAAGVAGFTHLFFVFNDASVSVYANGVLKGTGEITPIVDNTRDLYLGGGYSTNSPAASLYGKLDETRLRAGTLSADWIQAEYDTATKSTFTTNSLVYRNGLKVNVWLEEPDVTPRSVDLSKDDHSFTINLGRLQEGTVSNYFYSAVKPDEHFTDVASIDKEGTYYACFTMAESEGYEPVLKAIELTVIGHVTQSAIGGNKGDSGRVLLMNRDDNATCPIDYQGYYDNATWNSTYWERLDEDTSSLAYNLKSGTNSVLRKKGEDRLWHLFMCRHGNTFPQSDTEKLVSSQNYLPWNSPSAYKFSNRDASVVRSGAGWIVMQNAIGACVYSSCFTNGIGTIYFDAVNGWTAAAGENSKLRIQYATETDEEDEDENPLTPTDENCNQDYEDAETHAITSDWYAHAVWQDVPKVIAYKRDGTAEFERQDISGGLIALSVANGGTVDNFYRLAVPLNIEKPIRFRIVRESADTSKKIDQASLILLDNIIVSLPPMGADLKPTGAYDRTKRGATQMGWEMATTVPFPAPGETAAQGRAIMVPHVTDLDPTVETGDFVTSAKMHYRWRYLNQRYGDWKTVDLDPATFVSALPLEIPEREGDIEFWYDAIVKAPYYAYVDYSGTGLGIPYVEEIPAVTNHCGATDYPTATPYGTEWFFRLRRGASDIEGYRLFVETKITSNAYATVDFELVENHIWRGYLPTTDAVGEGLRFRLDETRPQDATLTELLLVTNHWAVSRDIAELPATATLAAGATNVWNSLVCDATTGYLAFQLDDRTQSLTVMHADHQDFNKWNDAHTDDGCFVGSSTDTNGMVGVSAKMRDYPSDHSTTLTFSEYTDTPATNALWREAFNSGTGNFTGYDGHDLFVSFSSSATPNGWIAGPGMFVNQQWKKASTTGAFQMKGQGDGSLEYPSMPVDPRGLESFSFKARLAQEIEFDDIAYYDAGRKECDKLTNYTFVAQAVMSDQGWTAAAGTDDFDGAGQISVFSNYRSNTGCYEFRVTRINSTQIQVALYKWTSQSGVLKATLMGKTWDVSFNNTNNDYWHVPYHKWRSSTSAKWGYPVLYISVSRQSDGSNKIQAGYSRSHVTPGSMPNANYLNLCYWDATNPLKGGSYGVASANCDARFVSPRCYDSSVTWLGYTTLNSWRNWETKVTFNGTSTGEYSNLEGDYWALKEGRTKYFKDTEDGLNRWGVAADIIDQKVKVEWRASDSGSWKELWTETVSGFTMSAARTKNFYTTTNGTYRISHVGAIEDVRADVVVDEVEMRQWVGDSFGSSDTSAYDGPDDTYGWRDRFAFTSGWVTDHIVTLSAKRTCPGTPSSIRSPLMDGNGGRGLGLGMIAFSYKNVNANAKLLVQVATNNVTGTAKDETLSLSDAVWTTVTNFTYATLGSSGSKNVYLGLHGVSGLMRIVLDPETVAAAQTSTDQNYGRIDITDVFCRDEPVLDLACWWGWNLRTMGYDKSASPIPFDDGTRMYLADHSANLSEAGLSLALNNSLNDIPANEAEQFKQHMPFLQTPTFVSNIVGEVTFRARMFSTDGSASAQKAEIRLYGTASGDSNQSDDVWKELAHFVVSNEYYETYRFRSPSEAFRAFRLGVSGVSAVENGTEKNDYLPRGAEPTKGTTPVRVMIEDVLVSEAVYPRLGFRYAYPVRTHLSDNLASPAIITNAASWTANCDEQPLVGENWTLQAELEVKQLPDELDLTTPGREPRVYFHWYAKDEPWGYVEWQSKGKTAELALAEGETSVYRGSLTKTPAAVAEEVEEAGAVVQYAATVVYWDKAGDCHSNVLSSSEWTRPSWYEPLDLNAGEKYFSAFSIFEKIAPKRVWINEVNVYDGRTSSYEYPGEKNQYIELAVPAGQSIDGWHLEYVDNTLEITNKFCFFGTADGEVPCTKRSNETNDYVFIVVQNPAAKDAGTWNGVKRPDGTPVEIDGTWFDFDGSGGLIDATASVAVRLVRASGIVEQEIAFEGRNPWADWGESDSLEGYVKKLNASGAKPPYYAIGSESNNTAVVGLDGKSLNVVTNIGATQAEWTPERHQTPGWCNEGQIVPENYVILPNGAMIVITAKLDGSGRIRQTVGDDVETLDSVRVSALKGGEGTNITYHVDVWYEPDEVTTNGAPMATLPASHRAADGRTVFTVNVGKGLSNNVTVVASARPWSELSKYGLDPESPYYEAVMAWLRGGKNYFGDSFENPGEVYLADYRDLAGNSVTNLTLVEMYWLDMDPTSSNWWFQAGISAPSPVDKPVKTKLASLAFATSAIEPDPPSSGITTNGVNIRVTMTMLMTNTTTHASYAPYILRGMTPGSTSYAHNTSGTGNWDSASFKITGDIQNDNPNRLRWVPLRWFYFMPDETAANKSASFDEKNQAVVDIWDPFDPDRSGTTTGWDAYKKSPVFYSWAIDTRNVPITVEPLKPDSTYK